MKRLRSKTRLDTLKSREAWRSGRWSRRIYLLILVLIGGVVLNYAFGDAFILRADGMIVRDRYAVSATYPAKVAAVYVKEGDLVEKGAILARLESADVLRDIAQLSVQFADVTGRDTQIRIKAATTRDLLPLAERHAEQARVFMKRYDTMKGLIPNDKQDQALGSEFMTASRLAELKSEVRVIDRQLPLMEAAQDRAQTALRQLDNFYDEGNLRAPVAGIVGPKIPVPGQVAGFGTALFDVYGEGGDVLAYLPEMYLFSVKAGQKVRIRAGRRDAVGTIEAVLPVTDALPPEFQNLFRPRDRGQLVRIAFPGHAEFAVSQKIQVSGCALGWCWLDGRPNDTSIAGWLLRSILS